MACGGQWGRSAGIAMDVLRAESLPRTFWNEGPLKKSACLRRRCSYQPGGFGPAALDYSGVSLGNHWSVAVREGQGLLAVPLYVCVQDGGLLLSAWYLSFLEMRLSPSPSTLHLQSHACDIKHRTLGPSIEGIMWYVGLLLTRIFVVSSMYMCKAAFGQWHIGPRPVSGA